METWDHQSPTRQATSTTDIDADTESCEKTFLILIDRYKPSGNVPSILMNESTDRHVFTFEEAGTTTTKVSANNGRNDRTTNLP